MSVKRSRLIRKKGVIMRNVIKGNVMKIMYFAFSLLFTFASIISDPYKIPNSTNANDTLRVNSKTLQRELKMVHADKDGSNEKSFLPKYKVMDFSNTNISFKVFKDAMKVFGKYLQKINLSATEISDKYLQCISECCPNLKTINLTGRSHKGIKFYRRAFDTQITDKGVEFLAKLTNLEDLSLGKCHNITDTSLLYLVKLKSLCRLDISKCEKITDEGLKQLASLRELEYLNLSGCNKITDDGFKHLIHLEKLRVLSLSRCNKITDLVFQQVASFKELQVLDLSGCNQITATDLSWLALLQKLQDLNLSGCNRITDTALNNLARLKTLRFLDLRNCLKITEYEIRKLFAALPRCLILVSQAQPPLKGYKHIFEY
jgi:hypothetical protein